MIPQQRHDEVDEAVYQLATDAMIACLPPGHHAVIVYIAPIKGGGSVLAPASTGLDLAESLSVLRSATRWLEKHLQ